MAGIDHLPARRLTDLYVRGDVITFDDGNGPVEAYIRKINPLDEENISRRSMAAKARFTRACDDEEGDEFLAQYATVRRIGERDTLVMFVCGQDIRRASQRCEAQAAEMEEWAKDGYLQSLRDAWRGDEDNPGLQQRYHTEPDDPEASRVLDELKRFQAQANDMFDQARQEIIDGWADATMEDIWMEATRALLRTEANTVEMKERAVQSIFYGTWQFDWIETTGEDGEVTRVPKWKDKRYFGNLDEVRSLDESVFSEISVALELLNVSPIEGKGSPAAPASSTSSESTETSEPSEVSGPEGSFT